MKHTQGPWSVNNATYDHSRESQRIDGPEGYPIAMTMQIRHKKDKTAAFYEAHANARLIAAAPKLLQALQSVVILLEPIPGGVADKEALQLLAEWEALISQATGSAS